MPFDRASSILCYHGSDEFVISDKYIHHFGLIEDFFEDHPDEKHYFRYGQDSWLMAKDFVDHLRLPSSRQDVVSLIETLSYLCPKKHCRELLIAKVAEQYSLRQEMTLGEGNIASQLSKIRP